MPENVRSLTDKEVLAGKHDLEMMRRRHLWPSARILPLKRRISRSHRSSHDLEFGTLVAVRDDCPKFAFLPLGISYAATAIEEGTSVFSLDGLTGDDMLCRLLVDAGWVVD